MYFLVLSSLTLARNNRGNLLKLLKHREALWFLRRSFLFLQATFGLKLQILTWNKENIFLPSLKQFRSKAQRLKTYKL